MKTYSRDQIGYLVLLARRELAALAGRAAREPGPDPGGWDSGFVHLSLRRNGILCGFAGARSPSLPEAVRTAILSAAQNDQYKNGILSADFESVVIELWIETGTTILAGDLDSLCQRIRLGQDGLRITLQQKTAYYTAPDAIICSISSQKQFVESLCRKAGLGESAWQEPGARLECITGIHALESPHEPSGVLLLHFLRRPLDRGVDPAQMLAATRLCATRMLAIQKHNGDLGYLYDPFADEWANAENRVRSAGCAYSLARAAHGQTDLGLPELSGSADRLLGFLIADTQTTPSDNGRFVKETDSGEPWGKLGSTALAALAAEFTYGDCHEESAQFVNTMLGLQEADGSFRCSIGREGFPPSVKNYFPGECLLALAWYARRTGDARASRAIGRSFRHYVEHFRREPAAAFVLWQTDAWSRVAGWLKEGSFPELGPGHPETGDICQFVFDQVDWLLLFQHTEWRGSPPEYRGGFKFPDPPRISATYVEAIIRACDLARLVMDEARVERYREAALLGLKFCLRLQVVPGTEVFFPRPGLVTGASTWALESFEMRCDHDQHFLTACLTALETPSLWD